MQVAKKKATRFYVALAIALILFLIFNKATQKPGEGLIHGTTKPIARFFSNTGRWFGQQYGFFSSIGTMKRDNELLIEENIKLKSQIALLNDIKNENMELKKQIELAPRDEYDLRAAMVIGRDLSGATESMMIDIGKAQGVKEQMAVVVNEGVLVGKVKKVMRSTSFVEFLTSNDSRVNAEIIETGAKGISRGQFGTSVTLDMIPQTVEIKKGDSVITSGVGSILPRGLLIGYTQDAVATADQLFQQTSLISPVDYENTRVVWVVFNKKGL